jgi:hypothetical protein
MPSKKNVTNEGGLLVFKSRFQSVNNLALHYLKTYHHMNCHNTFITNMYLLPHCSLPWKVDQLTEILPDIINLMIIGMFIKAILGQINLIQIFSYFTNIHSIASFHLFPGLQNHLFPRDLPTKIWHAVLTFLMCSSCQILIYAH